MNCLLGSTARNNSTLASLSSILGPPTPTSPTPARPSMSSRSSMSTRSKIVKKRDSFEGKRVAKLRVGDLVVVGSELADLGLMERESYEIRAIYYKRIGYDGQRRATYGGPSRVNVHTVGDVLPQTVVPNTLDLVPWQLILYRNIITVNPIPNHDLDLNKDDPRGWLLWVELFNPRYHSKPVAVRPERLGLTTVFEEISVISVFYISKSGHRHGLSVVVAGRGGILRIDGAAIYPPSYQVRTLAARRSVRCTGA
eukprot:1360729-Amorphochlora_amoeboformis.AAC.1